NTIQKCGSTLTLTAMGSAFGETNPPGTTYRWYTQSVGGVAFHTAAVYQAQSPQPYNDNSIAYYVSSFNVCESNRWKINLNYYLYPTITGIDVTALYPNSNSFRYLTTILGGSKYPFTYGAYVNEVRNKQYADFYGSTTSYGRNYSLGINWDYGSSAESWKLVLYTFMIPNGEYPSCAQADKMPSITFTGNQLYRTYTSLVNETVAQNNYTYNYNNNKLIINGISVPQFDVIDLQGRYISTQDGTIISGYQGIALVRGYIENTPFVKKIWID
ncbi:MAG: hypothetical protein NW207_09620, partial [Cytophagales bacterium]|nr:hypothetical protein [Cytophagales bacterium]